MLRHMLGHHTRRFAVILLATPWLLAIAGCSYQPANGAEHDSSSFQADLSACKEFGTKEGHRRVMAFGGEFLTYPVSLPFEKWWQTRKCMQGKGYVANL
jgi:hypothetical protein